MLSRSQIAEIARREGLPLHAIERDYIQHLFLRRGAKAPLIFKGGTCIRIAHGSPRFSEDLDFNSDAGASATLALLRGVCGQLRDYGVTAELVPGSPRPSGVQARLRYEGPLFTGTPLSRGSVRVEVSLRQERVDAEEAFVPSTPYADVPQLVLRVLPGEHLFAEKVRALLVRGQPRDLYDVHFLLSRGVRASRPILDAKMALYDRRFTLRDLEEGIRKAERVWARDLEPLLGEVPPFGPIARDVAEAMRHLPDRGPARGRPLRSADTVRRYR